MRAIQPHIQQLQKHVDMILQELQVSILKPGTIFNLVMNYF